MLQVFQIAISKSIGVEMRSRSGMSRLSLLHTPGHTPGSQCFLAAGALVSGDTLFIGGCGRVDLPGSDPDAMYHSLTQVLAKLPTDTVLFPGHNYASKPVSTIGDEKTREPLFAGSEAWMTGRTLWADT